MYAVFVRSLSHIQLFETPWTTAHQVPVSMGFSSQEDWSGLPFPFPGDLPDPVVKPTSFAWQTDSLPLSHLDISQGSDQIRSAACHQVLARTNDSLF